MDELEKQLRSAMAREQAPAWLEAKVLAAAARRQEAAPGLWQRWFALPRLRWVSATLATLVLATGIAWQRERLAEERAAGEEAMAKLELALRITSAKLQLIEQKIQQNN